MRPLFSMFLCFTLLLLFCSYRVEGAVTSVVAVKVNSNGAHKAGPVNVIINIPAQRLRAYQNGKCILSCRTAVGRNYYPGVGRNTKTRVV